MEILNLTSTSTGKSYSYDNNNLFFKLSVAESQLKEYFREESLIKAVNIIKEILSSKEIEKNIKNILNTLLSKIMECYTRCDNKTRFIINHIILLNKKKFSNIFLNKDIISYLIAVITCSDTIARGYSLQLISYLPALIEKRLDLLHTTFDLFINEKIPHDEKLIILELYKELLIRNSQTKVNLIRLLIDNLELIMSFKLCKNKGCVIRYCEACFNFRYKVILLYRVIIATRTNTECSKLVDVFKAYILKHDEEYFKISGYILLMIKSLIGNNEFLNFVSTIKSKFVYVGVNPNLSSYSVGLSLAYIVNFLDFEQIKSVNLFFLNFDLFKTLFVNNSTMNSSPHFRLQSSVNNNFFLAYNLCLVFMPIDMLEKDNNSEVQELFHIKKLNFLQFIKTLNTIIKINSHFSQTTNFTQKFKINSRNFKRFIDYFKPTPTQLNSGFIDSSKRFFENHKNVEELINILKHFHSDNEIGRDIANILAKSLLLSVKEFHTIIEFHHYFYLLCSCIKNKIDSTQFEQNLMSAYSQIKCSELSNFVLKGTIKYQLRYNRNNGHEQIAKLSRKNNFLNFFYIFKEYFISHKINDARKVLQHSDETINNHPFTENVASNFLNIVTSSKFQILNQINLIDREFKLTNEVDLLQLNTQLDNLSKERKFFFEKSKKVLTPFSSDFLSGPVDIIKNLFELAMNTSNNYDKHQSIMNNLTNTLLVIWLVKDSKLSELLDIKHNNKRNLSKFYVENIKSLILHYSKYLILINPPLDILIKYEAVKDKHDKLYKIGIKIKLKNIGDYVKCQDDSTRSNDSTNCGKIFCNIYADGSLIKKEWFDANNHNKDVDFIFENEKVHGDAGTGLGIKLQFYLIFEEFFIFYFYESTYSYKPGK